MILARFRSFTSSAPRRSRVTTIASAQAKHFAAQRFSNMRPSLFAFVCVLAASTASTAPIPEGQLSVRSRVFGPSNAWSAAYDPTKSSKISTSGPSQPFSSGRYVQPTVASALNISAPSPESRQSSAELFHLPFPPIALATSGPVDWLAAAQNHPSPDAATPNEPNGAPLDFSVPRTEGKH